MFCGHLTTNTKTTTKEKPEGTQANMISAQQIQSVMRTSASSREKREKQVRRKDEEGEKRKKQEGACLAQ